MCFVMKKKKNGRTKYAIAVRNKNEGLEIEYLRDLYSVSRESYVHARTRYYIQTESYCFRSFCHKSKRRHLVRSFCRKGNKMNGLRLNFKWDFWRGFLVRLRAEELDARHRRNGISIKMKNEERWCAIIRTNGICFDVNIVTPRVYVLNETFYKSYLHGSLNRS